MEFIERTGWKLNPNEKIVAGIKKGLERTGGECPCHNDGLTKTDRMCPCKSFVANNKCHCNLYIKDEKCFIWVARDKNGKLTIFQNKPRKNDVLGLWLDEKFMSIPDWLFPDVKWEDVEPTKFKIK